MEMENMLNIKYVNLMLYMRRWKAYPSIKLLVCILIVYICVVKHVMT